MDNQIIEIIGKLIAAIFVGIIAYLTPKIKNWLQVHAIKTGEETLNILIPSFVQAAEQLLHNDDPTGQKRMDYVKKQLTELGVVLTSEIISMIEGAVWEVNNQNKKHVRQEKVVTNGDT